MAEPDGQPDELASPGGTVYKLVKGSGKFGYEGVFAPHGPNKGFHAKLRLDENSKAQTTLPGPACKMAAEAALRLAKYRAAPFEIVKKDPDRAPKGEGMQSRKRPLEVAAPQEDPEDLPAWVVSRDAFTVWEAGLEPPASARLSAFAEAEVWRLRAWATAARAKAAAPLATVVATVPQKKNAVRATPAAVHTPVAATSGSVMQKRVQSVLEQQAGPSPQFHPDVLARVAAIKAGAVGDDAGGP